MDNDKYSYINEFLEGVKDGYISHLEMYSRIQDITDNFNDTKLKILIADIKSKIVEIGHFIDIYSVGIEEPQKDYEIQSANLNVSFLNDAIDYVNSLIQYKVEDIQITPEIEWKGTIVEISEKTISTTKNYPDIFTSEEAFKVVDHYCSTYNSKPQYDLGCLYHMALKKNFLNTRPKKEDFIKLVIKWGYLSTDEYDKFTDVVSNPLPIESKSLMNGRDKNFEKSFKLYFP